MAATERKKMEMRVLKVDLNQEEWEAKSAELARVVHEEKAQELALNAHKENSKNAAKALEEELKAIRGNRNSLATAVSTRQVDRDVPCDWYYHIDKKKAVLVRRDTGAALESRDLKPEELQLAIGEHLQMANESQILAWEEALAAMVKEPEPEAEEPTEDPATED